jgi:hypothetical protein
MTEEPMAGKSTHWLMDRAVAGTANSSGVLFAILAVAAAILEVGGWIEAALDRIMQVQRDR